MREDLFLWSVFFTLWLTLSIFSSIIYQKFIIYPFRRLFSNMEYYYEKQTIKRFSSSDQFFLLEVELSHEMFRRQ